LSKVLNLDSATLSPILKRLEKSGFITRKRNKEDERVVNLFLTKESIALEKDVARNTKASGLSNRITESRIYRTER